MKVGGEISSDNPIYLDIVERIIEALTPLGPSINDETIKAVDALALAVMKTLSEPMR